MKKVYAILLCLLLVLCFFGCGKSAEHQYTESDVDEETALESTVVESNPVDIDNVETIIESDSASVGNNETSIVKITIPDENDLRIALEEMGYESTSEAEMAFTYDLINSSGRVCSEVYVLKPNFGSDDWTCIDYFNYEYNEIYFDTTLNVITNDEDSYFSYTDSNDLISSVYYYYDGNMGLIIYTYPGYEGVLETTLETLGLPNYSDFELTNDNSIDSDPALNNSESFGVSISEWVELYKQYYLFYEDYFDIQLNPGAEDSSIFLAEITEDAFIYKPSNLDLENEKCYLNEISNINCYALWINDEGLVTRMVLCVDNSFGVAANVDTEVAKIWTSMQLAMLQIAYPEESPENLILVLLEITNGKYQDTDKHVCAVITESNACMLYIAKGDELDLDAFGNSGSTNLNQTSNGLSSVNNFDCEEIQAFVINNNITQQYTIESLELEELDDYDGIEEGLVAVDMQTYHTIVMIKFDSYDYAKTFLDVLAREQGTNLNYENIEGGDLAFSSNDADYNISGTISRTGLLIIEEEL